MKYVSGGVSGNLGQALVLEVPIAGRPKPQTQTQTQSFVPQQQPQPAAGPVVQETGDDIIVDPPVRLLPQYDQRWGHTRMAGTTAKLDWRENGCNVSTAAMTMRWFAEDCPAGRLSYPVKPGGKIDKTWYPPAMAECFWPHADPPGKVALTDPGGRIDTFWVFSICAHYLTSGGDLPRGPKGDIDHLKTKAKTVEDAPPEGWMAMMRKMMKTGPVIVGLGMPAEH